MSDSREESPDWLRSFHPPTLSAIELSSGSESPLDGSPAISDDEDDINLSKLFKKEAKQDSDINDKDYMTEAVVNKPVKGKSPKKNGKGKSPKKNDKVKPTPERKRQSKDESEREGKRAKGKDTNMISGTQKLGKSHSHSIWSLSSDSESSPDTQPVNNDKASKGELSANEEDIAIKNIREVDNILLDHDGEPPMNRVLKKLEKEDEKTSKNKNTNISINGENDVKEDSSRKHPGLQGSSSRLPLLLSEKVQRSKALVECEGDSIDLSGDVGSVGRIVVSDDPSKNHEMFLDLKGTIYKTTIIPSRTFCVVSFGQSEAKIEAIMNDYIQLKPQSNVFEAETMVEGTLDGFPFDSEDENEKSIAQADQHEAAEEQPDGKSKRKPDKTLGAARKKGKSASGKPPKKVKKKPQVSKKSKTKK
ncbi:DNA-binding protein BIN4 isoform X2 [Sesamum indicum]|uniref:DNA-binding protein BIN4 isoform X2 n=1 Tax=Sesamum indicum TaxID=4182 RepID=A0A6I9SY40_SESIN|nr:DNA-binding protein BIN4 isoform X2 [Sesamum indicum]